MATVWRVITNHAEPERAAKWAKREGRIAIGWGMSGDLNQYRNPDEIGRAILRGWPTSHNWQFGKTQLWDFANTMRPKDLVIVSTGGRRVFVGRITGEYEFEKTKSPDIDGWDYYHQRKIEVLPVDPDSVWRLAGSKPANGYNIRWTLLRCAGNVDVDALLDK